MGAEFERDGMTSMIYVYFNIKKTNEMLYWLLYECVQNILTYKTQYIRATYKGISIGMHKSMK